MQHRHSSMDEPPEHMQRRRSSTDELWSRTQHTHSLLRGTSED